MKIDTLAIAVDDYKVAADWYEGQTTNKIVLNLYGYTSNRIKYRPLTEKIVSETGMSALVFDYSGHGDSPFVLAETRQAQQFTEVVTVYDWLKSKYPDAEISVIGNSYGSFLAMHLIRYRLVQNLILRAPAIYQQADFFTLWKDINLDYTRMEYRKDVDELARHPFFALPVLFTGNSMVMIHERDELVPVQTTDAFIETLSADTYVGKGLWHATSNPGNPADSIADYQNKIVDWLNEHK